MKTKLEKVPDGYIIQTIDDRFNRFLYVSKVYNGRIDYTVDHTHAKHYKSRETAQRVIEQYIEPIEV